MKNKDTIEVSKERLEILVDRILYFCPYEYSGVVNPKCDDVYCVDCIMSWVRKKILGGKK